MRIIFILCTFIMLQSISAQNTSRVTVFNAEDAKEITIQEESVLRNAIKWNWSLLGRGVFMLNYERELKPWLSVEGGLGLCYQDWMFEASKGIEDILFDSYNDSENAVAIIKPAFEGRVRFYPFQLNDMEGFYCSLGYSRRNYKFETDLEGILYHTGYHINDTQFMVGWQYESWWIDNILADFYLGIGMRGYTYSFIDKSENNASTDSYIIAEETGNNPAFFCGFKLSIPF